MPPPSLDQFFDEKYYNVLLRDDKLITPRKVSADALSKEAWWHTNLSMASRYKKMSFEKLEGFVEEFNINQLESLPLDDYLKLSLIPLTLQQKERYYDVLSYKLES